VSLAPSGRQPGAVGKIWALEKKFKRALGRLMQVRRALGDRWQGAWRLFALRCAVNDLRVFVAGHFITTAVLVGLLLMQVVALGS
jgi:hypothetical protein